MSSQQAKNSRMIFVNLPVADLEKSKQFFAKLGFEFNPQFTDEKAACMIVSDSAFVMLLVKPFFQTFTKHDLCESATHTEALFALSCNSREEVDRLTEIALESGGKPAMPASDLGFMYSTSFYDLDSHHFELVWMNQG